MLPLVSFFSSCFSRGKYSVDKKRNFSSINRTNKSKVYCTVEDWLRLIKRKANDSLKLAVNSEYIFWNDFFYGLNEIKLFISGGLEHFRCYCRPQILIYSASNLQRNWFKCAHNKEMEKKKKKATKKNGLTLSFVKSQNNDTFTP